MRRCRSTNPFFARIQTHKKVGCSQARLSKAHKMYHSMPSSRAATPRIAFQFRRTARCFGVSKPHNFPLSSRTRLVNKSAGGPTRRKFLRDSVVGAAYLSQASLLKEDFAAAQSVPQSAYRLFFAQPAKAWVEALPVGNGSLGAM